MNAIWIIAKGTIIYHLRSAKIKGQTIMRRFGDKNEQLIDIIHRYFYRGDRNTPFGAFLFEIVQIS